MARKDRDWYAASSERKDRGILNKRERDYLATHGVRSTRADDPHENKAEDIEPGTAKDRQIRQQIRNHVMNGILDFPYLVAQLEDRDKRRIFNDGYDPEKHSESGEANKKSIFEVKRELPTIIAFIFQLYQLEGGEPTNEALAEVVRKGIETAYHTDGATVNVEVDIDIESGDNIDKINERFKRGGPEAIDNEEAFLLFEHERIDVEVYTNYIHNYNG